MMVPMSAPVSAAWSCTSAAPRLKTVRSKGFRKPRLRGAMGRPVEVQGQLGISRDTINGTFGCMEFYWRDVIVDNFVENSKYHR